MTIVGAEFKIIGEVKSLRCAPEDTIVITVEGEATEEQLERARLMWLAASGLPNRVVFLTGAANVTVAQPRVKKELIE